MSEQKGHLLSCTGQLRSTICIALAAQLTCFEDLFSRSNTTSQWEIFQGTLQGKSMRAMALFLTRQKSLDPETMINRLQEWLLLFRLSFSWSSSSSIVIIIADITICSSQQIWESDEGCKLWPSHHFQFYSSPARASLPYSTIELRYICYLSCTISSIYTRLLVHSTRFLR